MDCSTNGFIRWKQIALQRTHGSAISYPGRMGGHVVILATDKQSHPGAMSQHHLFPKEY